MKKSNEKRFKIKVLLGMVLLSLFVIMGCLLTPTPAAQERNCPTAINDASNKKGNSPKLIVVLVKEHPEYKEYAYQSLDTLIRVLPQLLEPEDRVIMLSMEHTTIKEALFFDTTVGFVDKPAISDTPVRPASISPSETPETTPEGAFGQAAAGEEAEANAQNTQTAATQSFFVYECEKQDWVTNNQAAWDKWDTDKQIVIRKFTDELTAKIENNKVQSFHNSRSLLFESTQLASLIFESECSKYVRCDLVIFSDFYDYRDYRPSEIKANLVNIEVAAMLPNCNFKYECQNEIDFWSQNFEAYGATGSQFALKNDVEKTLISYLGR